MKKTKEINVIESNTSNCFRVTLDGIDIVNPFNFKNFDEKESYRRIAKACAFDEILRQQSNGFKTLISYNAF